MAQLVKNGTILKNSTFNYFSYFTQNSRSPPPTRIRGQVFNEYEMSASDLNYGFVGSGGHGGHVGHGDHGGGGRVVGIHGMDTFAASSSCNDIMIGNSSSTPASSLSPAIFSSRKLLNDAVIMMCYLLLL